MSDYRYKETLKLDKETLEQKVFTNNVLSFAYFVLENLCGAIQT